MNPLKVNQPYMVSLFTANFSSDLITRVLYRLKFLGEQRAFDTVSVAYILPLIFLVLQNGGYAEKNSDAANEQLILTLEFLAFHTEAGKTLQCCFAIPFYC